MERLDWTKELAEFLPYISDHSWSDLDAAQAGKAVELTLTTLEGDEHTF